MIVPSRVHFSDLAFRENFKEICLLSYTCRYDGTYYGFFLTYELVNFRIPPVWNGFFHHREALTKVNTISRHYNIPWKSTKIPLFWKLFCVLSLWYVSSHTLPDRDRYGIYYGTKRMEYSIERERSQRREKKTYHAKNKSISTAKTYRWYRTVFNWNNMFVYLL